MVEEDPLKYAVPIPEYLLSFETSVDDIPEIERSIVDFGGTDTFDFADPERIVIDPDPTYESISFSTVVDVILRVPIPTKDFVFLRTEDPDIPTIPDPEEVYT